MSRNRREGWYAGYCEKHARSSRKKRKAVSSHFAYLVCIKQDRNKGRIVDER